MLAVHDFWPMITISIVPLFIIWIFETSGWSMSLFESTVNAKGSKPEYGLPSLSCISRVSSAVSPRVSGVLETKVNTRLFCVIKCCAISLKFSSVSAIVLLIVLCGTIIGVTIGSGVAIGVITGSGIVGVITGSGVGIVGTIGVTTGVTTGSGVDIIGTIGVIIDPVVTIGAVPVFTRVPVFSIGHRVGIVVLLL